MFSLDQIFVSALVGAVVSAVALLIYRRTANSDGARKDSWPWPLPLVVAMSILVYRAAANTAALNEDPISFISPNDVLCPVVTYVSLGAYEGLARSSRVPDVRVRGLLTVVSLVVNVVTI